MYPHSAEILRLQDVEAGGLKMFIAQSVYCMINLRAEGEAAGSPFLLP